MTVTLALLYHDPEGRLIDLVNRTLPVIADIFDGIANNASPQANPQALELWRSAGALVEIESRGEGLPIYRLGAARRAAATLALQHGVDYVMYCDGDRIVHWATNYPDELRRVVAQIPGHDFTVLGRTRRAFDSHPGVQRDTEGIVNQVFARVTGQAWDVGGAARGLSRRAVAAINEHCPDDTICVDVTWPLCLRKLGEFSFNDLMVEGLEFETGDGYGHQRVEPQDYTRWLKSLDDDPRRWSHRLNIAHMMVEKIIEYT